MNLVLIEFITVASWGAVISFCQSLPVHYRCNAFNVIVERAVWFSLIKIFFTEVMEVIRLAFAKLNNSVDQKLHLAGRFFVNIGSVEDRVPVRDVRFLAFRVRCSKIRVFRQFKAHDWRQLRRDRQCFVFFFYAVCKVVVIQVQAAHISVPAVRRI